MTRYCDASQCSRSLLHWAVGARRIFLALIGKRIAKAFMAHFLDLPESEKAHYAEIMKAYIDTAKSFTQLR